MENNTNNNQNKKNKNNEGKWNMRIKNNQKINTATT